jgi:hypothetical protein
MSVGPSLCDPTSAARKPMVDAVIAHAVKERLLPKALEAEADKQKKEQARWREQRRDEIIGKFSVALRYSLAEIASKPSHDYHSMPFVRGRDLLAKIDKVLAALDKE